MCFVPPGSRLIAAPSISPAAVARPKGATAAWFQREHQRSVEADRTKPGRAEKVVPALRTNTDDEPDRSRSPQHCPKSSGGRRRPGRLCPPRYLVKSWATALAAITE